MPLSLDGTGSIIGISTVSVSDDLTHVGDVNTKISFPAADTVTIETAGLERVRVDSSGNFGINTNNPTAELDVERATGTVEVMLQSRNSSDCFVSFGDNEDSDIGQIRYAHSDNSMRFTTNTGERLRITSGGDFGIGTDDPQTRLEVKDNSSNNYGSTIRLSQGYNSVFSEVASNFGGSMTLNAGQGTTTAIMHFQVNDDEKMRLLNNGVLLLGSSNTSNNIRLANKLGIVGTAAYTGMSISNYPGTNASHSPLIDFNRSRGTTDQNMTTVVASDKLGELIFRGSNGSGFSDGVTLRAYADTVSGSTVNGRFEIGTTNGSHSAKWIINKDGYVTKPYQPSFHVTTSGGQFNSNLGVINFNDTSSLVNHNTGSHYDTSNGRFTAPIAGKYLIAARMLTNSSTNSYTIYLIRRNGTTLGYIGHNHTDSWIMESGTWVMNLNANDYVDCYLSAHSGHGGYNYASFSGFLLG